MDSCIKSATEHCGYRRYLYHQGKEQTTGGTVEAAAKPWLISAPPTIPFDTPVTGMVPPASSSSTLSSSPPKALGLISCAAKSVENLSSPINLINLLQPTNHIVLDWTFVGQYFCGFVQRSLIKITKPSNYCICTLYSMCVISNICVVVNSLVTNYKQILLTNVDWPKYSVQNYSGKSK